MRAKKTAFRRTIVVVLAIAGAIWINSAKGATDEPARQVSCTGRVVDGTGEPVGDAKVRLYKLVPLKKSICQKIIRVIRPITPVTLTVFRVFQRNHKLTVNPEALTYDMALAQELRTEEDGAFTVKSELSKDEMSGQTIILVEKEGLALGWANWVLIDASDVEIKLDRPQTLAGKVVDETGKPISDAEVSIAFMVVSRDGQPRYLVSAESLDALTTRTDAKGKFSFGRIPPDATAEFIAKKPRKATVSTFNPENYRGGTLQYSSGQSDIEIALPPEARIEGTVVEKATGKPAAGIRIIASSGRNRPNFGAEPVVSGEDGTFTINALGPGTYTLGMVTPAGKEAEWIAETVEIVTEPGKTTSGVRIELSKGGLLEVVITEAAGNKPVADARVSIRQQDRSEYFGSVSDANGVAAVRLVPGEYQISGIYRDSYTRQQLEETVTIEDGKTTRVEKQLTSLPKITGVVRDEQDNPVQGAKLQVCPMGTGQDVSSDTDGKFEITWDPGRWHSSETPAMVLVARYEQGNLAAAVDVDEDTRTKDITLHPGLTLIGRVVDPDGKGIADSQVTPMLQGPRWGSSIRNSQATTDGDGKFEIKALPTEYNYNLYTRAEGYGENRSEETSADDAVDNTIDVGSITLAVANLSVSGVVVDNDDKPVAGVRVYCHGDNQPHRNTQTGDDGKFILDGVCAGELRISANKSGPTRLYGNVETEGGATDVKIVISERGSSSRYVPKQPPSLVGKPLPDLKDVNVDLPQADLIGKKLLVCFFDMQQRPSRHCLRQLNAKAQELEEKNIAIVGVQASSMDQDTLNDWCKKYNISFPVGMIQADQEKARFTWGVRSLPWLILTNRQHIIAAEGFGLSELDEKINAAK